MQTDALQNATCLESLKSISCSSFNFLQDICVFQSEAFGKVLLLDGERPSGTDVAHWIPNDLMYALSHRC